MLGKLQSNWPLWESTWGSVSWNRLSTRHTFREFVWRNSFNTHSSTWLEPFSLSGLGNKGTTDCQRSHRSEQTRMWGWGHRLHNSALNCVVSPERWARALIFLRDTEVLAFYIFRHWFCLSLGHCQLTKCICQCNSTHRWLPKALGVGEDRGKWERKWVIKSSEGGRKWLIKHHSSLLWRVLCPPNSHVQALPCPQHDTV